MKAHLATIPALLTLVLLVGCGGSSGSETVSQLPRDITPEDEQVEETNDDIPELANSFGSLPNYGFEDFQLDGSVQYWELREGPMASENEQSSETAWQYDAARYEGLSQEQQAAVNAAESQEGFKRGCRPADCALFGAAVTESGVDVIATDAELRAFFGDIDSEAELNMWLWANEYYGLTYEAVDAGYDVIAQWIDPMCLEDEYYRLFVDNNGVVTETEMVATRQPEVCS